MAVIQFSVPTDVYMRLVERGRVLGLSEHQVAKYLTILGHEDISDEALLACVRDTKREAMKGKLRAKPL